MLFSGSSPYRITKSVPEKSCSGINPDLWLINSLKQEGMGAILSKRVRN